MTRAREAALRAAALAYMALLLLAAVPPKLRPALLRPPASLADRALGALSIAPGLAIFSGPVTAVHRRASCLSVSATGPGGAPVTLYANECPPTGFRWRIAPRDELLLGLARLTRIERFVGGGVSRGSPEWRKLQALGDWFCHSPQAAAGAREEVTLAYRNLLVLYSSGVHSEDRAVSCRWRCGERPLAAPECTRAPSPAPRAPSPLQHAAEPRA